VALPIYIRAISAKNTRKIILTLASIAAAAAAAPCGYAAAVSSGAAELVADSMNYDPRSNSVTAVGNVRLTSPDGELFGDSGFGYTNGRMFEMRGNVRGMFAARSLDIVCDYIELEIGEPPQPRRKITATGNVVLTRAGDRLTADHATWNLDSENYAAAGDVLMDFGGYFVDSDEAGREGERFWARNVRRYEDRARKMSISASSAEGRVRGDTIVELITDGAIAINMLDGGGTRITGNKGVFSQDRGTIVVSGNAQAIQEGRSLTAGSIVYHLDSGRVEALGERPTIIFEMRN
jgi:lipopolysaccharide assembly outer membrane protein LptD (OstA)